MAKKTKKMGRPKKYDIDVKLVEEFAALGATNTYIADYFGCDESLIRKTYSENLTKGRTRGNIKLLQAQYKAAMNGNVTMLIWLGKQRLGQREKTEHSWENPVGDVEFIDV